MFCFIGETRDFLHGIFRTGKAHSGRGVKRFVDECLKMISEGIREIFLRADSGFYDGDFLNYLEKKGILYAIVVKLYPWIQMELIGLKYRISRKEREALKLYAMDRGKERFLPM